MLANYLTTLYRTLTHHRLFSVLNILGLAVGMAVFLVLALDVRFETSFEHWIPNGQQIYLFRTSWLGPWSGQPIDNGTTGGLLDELRADYPQLVATRMQGFRGSVKHGSDVEPAKIEAVDQSFFRVFNLPLTVGGPATALARPENLVLTETQAKRYFGDQSPMGKTVILTYGGALHTHQVAGVLKDPPGNTDLKLDFIVPLKSPTPIQDAGWWQWTDLRVATYARFNSPSAQRALQADLPRFIDRHASRDVPAPARDRVGLILQPLWSMHLLDRNQLIIVAALGLVGLLTLLLAAMNYVNLATARAALRAREVALRRVLGATRVTLIVQFVGEAVATALLSALLGVALCELSLPLVNAAAGLSLKIDYLGLPSGLPVVVTLAALVGIGSGFYPALVISGFQPAMVLASARAPGGGRSAARVREGLVAIQFAIAIAFMVATGVMLNQIRFLRGADLGFDRHGLIVISSFDDPIVTAPQRATLLASWRSISGVISAAAADTAPGDEEAVSSQGAKRPGAPGDGPGSDYVLTGPDFFQTYQARLVAGRFPNTAHGGDYAPADFLEAPPPGTRSVRPLLNVVLNDTVRRRLGFASPAAALNQRVLERLDSGEINQLQVIGVVEDIRFHSPRSPIQPTIYLSTLGNIDRSVAVVRYAGDPRQIVNQMRTAWHAIIPSVPFRADTGEGNLAKYYRSDDQRGRLFTAGAGLAVAIGCLGLYGLASFNTSRRVREIGIRKTLGASAGEVFRLLVAQFLKPVGIAILIAWPAAFFVMRAWLSGFDQRIALTPIYFVASAVVTVLIALITVSGQAFSLARAEPGQALRHE